MRCLSCPYCQGAVDVLDSDLGRMVQCDKVRCGKFFLALGPDQPPSAPPTAGPIARVALAHPPVLTGPHRCLVCLGEVTRGLGRRRCTVIHRPARTGDDDPRDNCRMDVYAAIYFCPHCRPATLLETPYYQWGQAVRCPVCQVEFRAPRDDVLHERPSDAREGTTIRFRCPSCDHELRCDSTRQGRSIAGQRVVCHLCHHLIEVPGYGERASGERRA